MHILYTADFAFMFYMSEAAGRNIGDMVLQESRAAARKPRDAASVLFC